jgi:hypothetical protein
MAKAVTRIKTGKKEFARGDSISASDVGGSEELERLQASGSVVSDSKFKALFPDREEDEDGGHPTVPSNLHSDEVESDKELAATQKTERTTKKAAASQQSSGQQSSGGSGSQS